MKRILYLNNSGHRWIYVDEKGRRDKLTMEDGSQKSVKYWEAIGNFAVPFVRSYVGGKEKVVPAHPSNKKDVTWRIGLDN